MSDDERQRAAARDSDTRKPRRGRAWAIWVSAAALTLLPAPLGWWVTDRLEQDNEFCTACHLQPDVPLHRGVRDDFDAVVPVSLAGIHGRARNEARPDGTFRCIDCHGGHSLAGRVRVKALAAKDAFWYVAGRFDEPEGMRWPLWDEDCTQCHAKFEERPGGSWQSMRFHQIAVHNIDLGVDCVACHLVHEPGGNPEASFLHAEPVRAECARCHQRFEIFEEDQG